VPVSKQAISFKWILIGENVIILLNLVGQAILADPVRTKLLTAVPGVGGQLLFAGIIAFVSFFIGGVIIGIFSPGETVREPAYAAVLAAGFHCTENFRNVDGQNITVGSWFIGSAIVLVVGFLMALGGGWVGEKLQGDTEEKHRESQAPPPPTSQSEA
jgi:hypothetical protein